MAEKVSTEMLLKRISRASSLSSFLEKNEQYMVQDDFSAMLKECCRERNLIPERVIHRAQIDRTYGHQLFNGTRRPSRDKVLQLAIGMEMNLEETQRLLQAAGTSTLYPRVKRDAAIIFCLHNGFDMMKTNETLNAYGFALLGE